MCFASIDGDLGADEAALVADVLGAIDTNFKSGVVTKEQIKDIMRRQVSSDPVHYASLTMPYAIPLLEYYDYGTDYVDKTKAMFFRCANAVVKADGMPSKIGEDALQRFKETLYPADVTLNDHVNTQTVANSLQSNALIDEPKGLDELLSELDALIGLEQVKGDVTQLVNFLKVQQIRKSRGLDIQPISRHLVFYGNPGTGKTTIARLLSQIYKSLGMLSIGHAIETDRSGLVAGYIGR